MKCFYKKDDLESLEAAKIVGFFHPQAYLISMSKDDIDNLNPEFDIIPNETVFIIGVQFPAYKIYDIGLMANIILIENSKIQHNAIKAFEYANKTTCPFNYKLFENEIAINELTWKYFQKTENAGNIEDFRLYIANNQLS